MKGIVSTPDSLTSTKTRRVYPFVFIANDVELQKKADILFKQSLEQVNHRVLHENNLECIKNNEFTKEELSHWIDGIPHQMKAEVEIDHGQFKDMVNSMLDDNYHGQVKDVYFYHSDHLGSASWITDYSGTAVQHLQYLPFGEPFVNEHATGAGYSERFTFTGKERDEGTGYGYFGARYMDHELTTMWLSVDPMADKYPSISPYAYCAWNPIKLVDSDGRKIDSVSPELKPLVARIRFDDPILYNQLERSSDSYRIVYGNRNNGAGGAFTYVPNADNASECYLEISILPSEENYEKFSQLESLAHEMRHAKQYEDKQLGFMVLNGGVSPMGYDLDDEIQCYEYADRYANINSRKTHNEWVRFVKFNYPFLVDHSNQTPRPKTPLEWVDKNHNIIPELYRDPSEIVRGCNSSGRKTIPFYKMRE